MNGCYYYGCHTTRDLFDGYMGSGVLITKAIKFYGIENFEMVMIKNYPSRKAMFAAERRLITKEVITKTKCYNLITGGAKCTKNTYKVKAKTKFDKAILS